MTAHELFFGQVCFLSPPVLLFCLVASDVADGGEHLPCQMLSRPPVSPGSPLGFMIRSASQPAGYGRGCPEMMEALGSEEVKAGRGRAGEFLTTGCLTSDGEQRGLKPDTPLSLRGQLLRGPQSPVAAGFSPEEFFLVNALRWCRDGCRCPGPCLSAFLSGPACALKMGSPSGSPHTCDHCLSRAFPLLLGGNSPSL